MHRRRGERQKPPLRCRRRFARIRKHCYRRREKCLLWFSLFLTFAQAPPCPSDGDAIDTETVIFLFFLSSLPPPPPPPPTPPEIALCYSWQQPVEEEDIFPPRFHQFHLIPPPPPVFQRWILVFFLQRRRRRSDACLVTGENLAALLLPVAVGLPVVVKVSPCSSGFRLLLPPGSRKGPPGNVYKSCSLLLFHLCTTQEKGEKAFMA